MRTIRRLAAFVVVAVGALTGIGVAGPGPALAAPGCPDGVPCPPRCEVSARPLYVRCYPIL